MKKEIKEKFSKNKDNMEFYDQDVDSSENTEQRRPPRRKNNRSYRRCKRSWNRYAFFNKRL